MDDQERPFTLDLMAVDVEHPQAQRLERKMLRELELATRGGWAQLYHVWLEPPLVAAATAIYVIWALALVVGG